MKRVLIILLGIVLAFSIGAIVLEFQNFNSIESYLSMFKNSLFSDIAIGNTFSRSAILLLLGLSAFISFNTGSFNLGQYGQLLTGAFAATVIGLYVNLPSIILIPVMLLAAGILGSLFAGIAAYFKYKFAMDEFITTLMLNFVAQFFITYLVSNPLKDSGAAWPMSPSISDAGVFAKAGIFDFSVIIALLLFIGMYIYWKKTRIGYELRMLGANSIFARLGGTKVSRNFFKAMLLSGFLAGVAGAFLIMGSGQQNKLIPSLGEVNASDGIMIALISGGSILSVLFFSVFFSILQTGAVGMQLDTNVPMEFTIILQATMVLLVVAFRDYSSIFIDKMKTKKKAKVKAREKSSKVRGENRELTG